MSYRFFTIVLLLLFTGAAVSSVAIFDDNVAPTATPYKEDVGPHEVAIVKTWTLQDSERDKELEIKLFFPTEKKKYPVVIVSHGLGGSKDGLDPWGEYLASHGYVAIMPTHADSLTIGIPIGLGGPNAWDNRVKDCVLIMDSLKKVRRKVPGLKGKIDRKKIGQMGHSYGAYTSQLISGVQPRPLAKRYQFEDERPLGFIYLSGQGEDKKLRLVDGSWDGVDRPVLVMTGSLDAGRNGEDAEWRTTPYYEMPAGDKYLAWFDGAYHFTFSGKTEKRKFPEADPEEMAELFSYIRMYALAFWDYYLKGDAEAGAYLTSGNLPLWSNGDAEISFK